MHEIPAGFYAPLLFLVFSLALDFLHYVIQTITWATFYYIKVKNAKLETEIERPSWLVVLPWILFSLKVVAVLIAYIQLLKIILDKIDLIN